MIQEAYCSYEVAKLLKDKGFPMREHSMMYTNKNNVCLTESAMRQHLSREDYLHFGDFFIQTVTCQMAMKWLREIHELYIEVLLSCDREDKNAKIFDVSIFNLQNQRYKKLGNIQGYEEAIEVALKYSLEKLI